MTFPALFHTPERLIVLAYEDAGLTQEGDSPNSEQIARGMTRLNDIINLWCTQGLKLWSLTEQTVTLIDGQQAYTFKPAGDVNITKPMRILQGYMLIANSQGTKRPIYPMSWNDWMILSNVQQEGAISQYFVDKLYDRITVKFWLIPDATEAANTAHLLVQNQITNFSELTENLIFPQEWFIALRWALADDLCTGQPEAIVVRCATRAQAFRAALENWDVEDVPTQFAPDPRMGFYTGTFR